MSFSAYLALLTGVISNRTGGRTAKLIYVVDKENWAVRTVGSSLAKHLSAQIPVHLSTTALGSRWQLVHFGSIDMYMTTKGWHHIHPSNNVIVTVFHLAPTYQQTHLLAPALNETTVHTTNTLTQTQLIAAGVEASRIHVIPLGVDTNLFRSEQSPREAMRRRYNINPKSYVIGSFQKDGVGWGEGLEPKLIKGPDTLVETVALLAQQLPVHVLLSGPARGYVIEQLKARNIPYSYTGYYQQTEDVAALYQALDLYLITARVEGGPLQLLEAWAAGVPLVATPVGMVNDIATHNRNVLIAPIENPQALAAHAARLLRDPQLAERLRQQAQQDTAAFDWRRISQRYQTELYQPHLTT